MVSADITPQPVKPNWMATHVFNELRRIFEKEYGQFECTGCGQLAGPGSDLTLSWDHIVPRSAGGEDVVDNLQPMCVSCNSRKANHPDGYWDQRFYFDGDLHLENARSSQREYIYNQLLDYPQFSDPYSFYSGHLFCCCQIVGAGKTLGMMMVPFALNQLAIQRGPGRPRVNRMLILAKSKDLRDQIVRELRYEPQQYGLVDHSPDVVAATSLDIFTSQAALDKHDIFVSTQQLLWNNHDRLTSDDQERIFRSFPLICFDEVHFASGGKVQDIAYKASQSLCFGFTATPLQESEESPRPMANTYKVSVYGIRNAIASDNSMKGLGDNHSRHRKGELIQPYEDIIVESTTDRIHLADRGDEAFDPTDPDHQSALGNETTLTVAYEVIQQLKIKEMESVENSVLSLHREFHTAAESRVTDEQSYPGHAIIRVKDVTTSEVVCDAVNEYLASHRDLYPRKDGWHAETAHGGNQNYSAKPLDRDHPWFYAKNHRGKVTSRAARILVAVDLATEGVNNKFTNVIGFASTVSSIRSVIQSIGRAVRSTHKVIREDGKTIHEVPSAAVDNISIVTHQRFENRPIIVRALEFMDDMEGGLREIPDLDAFFEQQTEIGGHRGQNRAGILDQISRITAVELGSVEYLNNRNLTDRLRASIARKVNATTDAQKHVVDDILDLIWSEHPQRLDRLKRSLYIQGNLQQKTFGLRETSTFNPTPNQIDRFARGFWGDERWQKLRGDLGDEGAIDLATATMRGATPSAGKYEYNFDTNLSGVFEKLRGELMAKGFRVITRSDQRPRIDDSLRTAFALVTGDANCFESDEFNHHSVVSSLLTDHRLQARLIGYTAWELARAGILQGIQTTYNL